MVARNASTDERRAYRAAYYLANKERLRAQQKEYVASRRVETAENHRRYRAANLDHLRAKARANYLKNWEARNANNAQWAAGHPEVMRATKARWARENPGCVNAKTARRRARKHQATPAWLTDAQKAEIKLKYTLAKAFGNLEVDHIVPLKHPDVCGLHVPWNLQYLDRIANATKGNRLLEMV